MITFITAAVVFGLSAGFSPGPLLTLVIAQTLGHGVREGIKVSLAPLVTDIPIICLALLLLSRLSHFHAVLGWISIAGGVFVMYLAFGTLRAKGPGTGAAEAKAQSLGKGIAVNALSPHPYIFWITVGSPIILKAAQESFVSALSFIFCFLACLVGSKIFVAVIVGRTRNALAGKAYRYVMVLLGLLLIAFALFLIRDGLSLLKIFPKAP